jgi:hypothetical protein
MRAAVAAFAALLMAAPPAALANSGRAGDLAAALRDDPVYVAPSRAQALSPLQAGRIRLRIVDRDIGRVHIAVIPFAWAREAGGLAALANGVDSELGGERGALLLEAQGHVYLVTSHRHDQPAVAGLKRAFAHGGDLERHLTLAVDALAREDPGPEGDIGAAATPPNSTDPAAGLPDATRIVDTVNHGIELTFVIIVIAFLVPILLVAWAVWRRSHNAAKETREVMDDELADARSERAALGDDIVDLDVATSMPDIAPVVRTAYERALDAYEKSEQLLATADSRRRLERAKQVVADGRRDAATARAGVGSGPPASG